MPEYSRELFSKYSKDQLLNYIEQQNEQMGRLEARFRDVVRAYKGVLKEKEALEATVKALSVGQEQQDDTQPQETEESNASTNNKTNSEAVRSETGEAGGSVRSEAGDPVRSEAGDPVRGEAGDPVRSDLSESGDVSDSGAEIGSKTVTPIVSPSGNTRNPLKQQLSTLTTAMATLTEEKSKMEASFQQDKRTMLAQQDSLTKQLQTERENTKKEIRELQRQVEETREALRSEQLSRQDEQETNAQMMRELQALIATERDHSEALSVELDEVNKELLNIRERVSREKVQEYEELIRSMSIELEQVKGQLAVAERQADPSPQILKLQQAMKALKVECEACVRREQGKVTEREERLRAQAQHEEERVCGLEARLSSLCETVGGYERLRENDQATILKLKERVAQLDSENTALTKEHIEREGVTAAEMSAQITALQEKVNRLKALLKLATQKLNESAVLPPNMEELSVTDYSDILSSQPSGKEYQQELSQLREEFERYKTRAQSVLKNRAGSKDGEGVGQELEEVRQVNEQLVREVESLRERAEEEGRGHSQQLQTLRGEMRERDDRHRREMADTNTQYRSKLQELETQVQATRSRTLNLIKEKDTEIQQLKAEVQSLGGRGSLGESPIATRRTVFQHQGSTSSVQEESSANEEGGRGSLNLSIRSADSSTAVQELFDKSSPGIGGRRLLHEVQERQARDSELAAARRKRVELEDLNRDLLVREQRHFEQITFLKGEIRKLERDRSRETESMEYLKNIVMHYMCADSAGRDQLISPIATVLHFSTEEVSAVKRKIAARRWLSAAPK